MYQGILLLQILLMCQYYHCFNFINIIINIYRPRENKTMVLHIPGNCHLLSTFTVTL